MYEYDICHAGIIAGVTVTFYGKFYVLPVIDYLVADEFTRDPLIISFGSKNSPHRTESVRAIISHGDVRGRVQAAYHAGQARESDHGPR